VQRDAIRILCVDDHEVMLEGLVRRIALEPDLLVVGRLSSASDLIAEARRYRPDLVVLDIAMPGTDPFDAATDLQAQLPDTRTVFLTAHVRDRYLDRAFHCGAWGYLYKGDSLDDIIDGLRRAAAGTFVMSPVLLRTLDEVPARPRSKLGSLTPRELQVLELIGRGLSSGEIADTLHRSRKTIDTHRASLMKKLGIHDRTGLALYAVAEGLVDVGSIRVPSHREAVETG
jgi:DNA-binding NarL/FixJ family response regulator